MSVEFKTILLKLAKEDYKNAISKIEKGVGHYKSLILAIEKSGKWDLPVWIEGSDAGSEEDFNDLQMLERSNLIKGNIKYTHHNLYREYELTERGIEVAKKLLSETKS
jgi:hypothetical protein